MPREFKKIEAVHVHGKQNRGWFVGGGRRAPLLLSGRFRTHWRTRPPARAMHD